MMLIKYFIIPNDENITLSAIKLCQEITFSQLKLFDYNEKNLFP